MKHFKITTPLKLEILFVAILYAIIVLTGCSIPMALNKAEKNGLLAKVCAEKYPVKDSILPPVIEFIGGDNIDYSPLIDSLKYKIDSIGKLYQNSVSNQDSLCNASSSYLVEMLQNATDDVAKLKSNYKKCTPDTVKIRTTEWKADRAKEAVLAKKLDEEHKKLDEEQFVNQRQQMVNNEQKEALSKIKKKLLQRSLYLYGLMALLAIAIGFKLSKRKIFS
jgi:hypothetical protein